MANRNLPQSRLACDPRQEPKQRSDIVAPWTRSSARSSPATTSIETWTARRRWISPSRSCSTLPVGPDGQSLRHLTPSHGSYQTSERLITSILILLTTPWDRTDGALLGGIHQSWQSRRGADRRRAVASVGCAEGGEWTRDAPPKRNPMDQGDTGSQISVI